MHKLCVILSSSYDRRLPSFFNEEIQHDLTIIKSTLHDHQICEIIIPHTANRLLMMNIIKKNLTLFKIKEDTHCHIVLNTHGIPGYSDIKSDCVIYLVNLFSQMNISISQISALLCDGMQPALTNPSFHHDVSLPDTPKKSFMKEAYLIVLQKQLNALVLEHEQHFFIHGFEYAYSPLEDSNQVLKVLQGNSTNPLEVSIRSTIFSEEYFKEVLINTQKFKKNEGMSIREHQALSNFFAQLLNYMKQHIFLHLQYHKEIPALSEFHPLWQALCAHATENKLGFNVNVDNLQMIYRHWLKSHKIYSLERLSIFSEFSQLAIEKMQSVSSHDYAINVVSSNEMKL